MHAKSEIQSYAVCNEQGASAGEWKEAHGSALLLGRRGADLEEQMARSACMLVMEYIPGRGLFQLLEPFQPPQILRTAEDLGRSAHRPFTSKHCSTVGRLPSAGALSCYWTITMLLTAGT